MRREEYAMLRYLAGGYYLLIRYPFSLIIVRLVIRPKWTDNESLDDSKPNKTTVRYRGRPVIRQRLTGPYCIRFY